MFAQIGFLPFYFDSTILILIPGLILGIYAQIKINGAFSKYSKVRASSGVTGAQVASRLLRQAGIEDVVVEQIDAHLGDHYDPRKKVLRLSPDVYHGTSLAALGVAAHEAGHAMQHAVGYTPLIIRNSFAPIAGFGSRAWIILFLIGMLFAPLRELAIWGVYAFGAVVVFQLITLPVEFNASNRAIGLLEAGGFITRDEVVPARKVLNAAALTYIAALVMAVLQLIRLMAITGMLGRRDD